MALVVVFVYAPLCDISYFPILGEGRVVGGQSLGAVPLLSGRRFGWASVIERR